MQSPLYFRPAPVAAAMCFSLCALSLIASHVYAGYGSGGMGIRGGGGGGGGGTNSSHVDAPPPIDRSASTKARREVNTATGEVTQANNAVAAIVARLKAKLEKTSEWLSAQAALKSAQSDVDKARASVIRTLSAHPDYQAAKSAGGAAQTQREQIRNDPSIEPQERLRIAKAVIDSSRALADLETAALAADPAHIAAKTTLAKAAKSIDALLATFEDSLKQDSDWQAAIKVLQDKKHVLADAQKTLGDALAQETQAERARQKQIASQR
jgi:hypothetical protein